MIWIVEVKTKLDVLTAFYWEHLFPDLKSLRFRDFRSDSVCSCSSILLRWRAKKKAELVVAPFLWCFSFSYCVVWLPSFPFDVLRCLPSPSGSSNLSHSPRAGDDHRDLQGSLRPRAQHRRGQRHSSGGFLLKSCLLQPKTKKTWKIIMPLMCDCSNKLLEAGRTSQL